MFKKIKEFFVGKPAPVAESVSAPYKVPEPAAITPIPFVVTNSTPADNVPVVAEVVEPVVAESVVETTPAKTPRKPRAPKAAPVAAKPAKAPAKKPAARTAKSKKV